MDTRARLINSLVAANLATDERSYLRAELLADTLAAELSDRDYELATAEAARQTDEINREG